MRLLHTSDWHLGRAFHRVNMLDAQAGFIGHLVDTAREREADAVVVSGDVYDRAVPPLAAVQLFDDALHRLADLGVPTIMISGNHDSARRLGVGAGLIDRAGIHLRTDATACGTPVVLTDGHGDVAFYGLPYLEPALVKDEFGVDKPGHEAVLAAAMDRVRADLATRAPGIRSVVLAHAFVTGGAVSDSERDITVGGVASVPAGVFDGVDYTALGHLHGSQTISERVRYSGSPSRTPSRRPTTARPCGWWTSGPTAPWTRSGSTAPCHAASPASAATWRTCSPTRASRVTRTPGSRPPSPTRCGPPIPWPG